MLEGLRGEQSVLELCRREGIASNLYYRWSKVFLEGGKKQLAGTCCPVRGIGSMRLDWKPTSLPAPHVFPC